MADILPFQAFRYDQNQVSLAKVVTQPYDKITPAMQDRYYHSSPYNLVRIILGKAEDGDQPPEVPGAQNVYTRAAAGFQQWRRLGILRQDPEPSIYVYSQQFSVPGMADATAPLERRGFIALGRIEDYSAGVVFRHEQTLSKPKQDRLNLLRATRGHFGQIFVLYSDPRQEVDQALHPASAPVMEVSDEYGVRHRVWRICDPKALLTARELMADKKLIIADGHHRYETALTYRNECRAQGAPGLSPHGQGGAEAAYERVMMTFVNMDAPGLLILPTHRVVHGLQHFDQDLMLKMLWPYFEVEKGPPSSDVPALAEHLRQAGQQGTAVLAVTAHESFLLRARAGAADSLLSQFSQRQRQLDVVQLHAVVLQEALAISPDDIRNQKHVLYLREAAEAVEKVRRAEANVAFLINPVRVGQVRDIAFAGEVLPQKSTDFYPKLLSGLTIYALP